MGRLYLRVSAPFAAYRGMQAGVYRTTAPMMPPSAALGLVLNLAGVEMRDAAAAPNQVIRADVPRLRLALGALSAEPPVVGTLYQQLHGYPVGSSGKELRAATHGAKYWIAPVRREILVGFRALIGVESEDPGLLSRVRRGLRGELEDERYGLPFAGDNNLLFDRIDVLDVPEPARWYTPVTADGAVRSGACRLTVGIDRADSSRTTLALLAPSVDAAPEPPEEAWLATRRADSR